MRKQIVEFKNGNFGVRRWFFGYEYLSNSINYWWRSAESIRDFCQFASLEDAKSRICELKVKKVHKIDCDCK